ncbi:MAG: DAK2 domain-containing protein [Mycobacteriaceae bacterium]
MPDRRLDASALRDWAHSAVGDLLRHADEINRLNVFPVADSDTGTNMLFTMRSALAEADPAAASGDVAKVAAALARGASDGARGNSGVILAQILRALADVTADAKTDTDLADTDLADVDAALLAATLRHAVVLVVSAMGGEVVAGTVVSVLQVAADAVEQGATEGAGLAQVLTGAGEAAEIALERTPDQLPVLAEAGVVDAGGRGLLVLLDTLTATITGHSPHRRDYQPGPAAAGHGVRSGPAAAGHGVAATGAPQFEVMYLVGDCDVGGLDRLRAALERLGDSIALAPSTADRHSVHVHTDDAGAAVEAGLAAGAVSKIRISALASGRVAPGAWSRQRAVLAVIDGDGAEELFRAEGATVVRPDADLIDPDDGVSAEELLRALVDTGAAQVMVLPNGYVSAEDLVAGCTAAIGWGIDVVALPAGSMVAGLAALAVHDPSRQAVDDGYTMARAAAGSRHGSVRLATGKALTWAGACEPGDGLGIAGEEVVVVAADLGAAAVRLIDLLMGSGGELITVLIGEGAGPAGDDIAESLSEHVRRRHPGTEFSSYRTDHRGDVLLVGVE